MKLQSIVKQARLKKKIKRLEAIEEEIIRFENPKRFYLLKELEEKGMISDATMEDFKDSTFIDVSLRKKCGGR